MDELSQIQGVAKRKIEFLDRLKWDCQNIRTNIVSTDSLANLTKSPNERRAASADADTVQATVKLIEDAIVYVQKEHAELPEMMDDLKSSLHDVRHQDCFL